MPKNYFRMLLAVAAAFHITGAAAHSPYLLPNHFDASKRDHVSVQGSFTEDYLVPDVVMKSDDYHAVLPDGTRVSLAPSYTKDLAVMDVDTTLDGTYRISTGVREGRTAKAALMPDGQWQFFAERDGAPAGGKVYEIKSVTRADVYVSRGTPTEAVLKPTNQGFEFQMLSHPNRLLAGGPVKLRILRDGKPVTGQNVSVHKAALNSGEATPPVEQVSDADGVVTTTFALPGIYHLMARHRFVLPSAEGKAESHTYALSLEIAE